MGGRDEGGDNKLMCPITLLQSPDDQAKLTFCLENTEIMLEL